jgi:hypothetical protein
MHFHQPTLSPAIILHAREARPFVGPDVHAYLLEALCELRPVIVTLRHSTSCVITSR